MKRKQRNIVAKKVTLQINREQYLVKKPNFYNTIEYETIDEMVFVNSPASKIKRRRTIDVFCGCLDDCSSENCANKLNALLCVSNVNCKNDNCMNKLNLESLNYNKLIIETKEINVEKGMGVVTKENIKMGSFIIEYVGEVINTKERNKREKLYNSKNFYFMRYMNSNTN